MIFKTKNSDTQLTSDCRQLLEEFALLCQEVGYSHSAYADARLLNFDQLSTDEGQGVVQRLRLQLEILNATKTEVGSVLNNATAVWKAMVRFGLVPPAGLLNRLTDAHVIEIFDTESRQIFKTFNFLPLTTHTLEDLHCLPWYKLWKRDEEALEKLLVMIHQIHMGELKGVFEIGDPGLMVQEIGTLSLRTGIAKDRFGATLTDRNGRLAGYLAAFVVEKVWDANTEV